MHRRTIQIISKRAFHTSNMSLLKTIGSTFISSILEKPTYKDVTANKNDAEERHYDAAKWVSTKVEGISYKEATSTGFRRLFNYITGTNDREIKIDMTAPVSTKVEPGAGPNCESTFTVSFFIPQIHQENPPKPTNPDVFIENRPEQTVFVQKFGGFANEESWIDNAKALTEKLEGKQKFESGYWYTAGYNSPFQLMGRTNEVWFVKNSS